MAHNASMPHGCPHVEPYLKMEVISGLITPSLLAGKEMNNERQPPLANLGLETGRIAINKRTTLQVGTFTEPL